MVLVLNGIIIGLIFLAGCAAIPAVGAILALQGQAWMASQTITMPRSGPLDGDLPQTAIVTARDGTLLSEIGDVRFGRRSFVPLNELSQNLVLATMATEDRRYYEHRGVDMIGLMRAISSNAEAGDATQGASTIEMQLVRNLFLPDERTERTLSRKIKEAMAAVELDKRYSKDELIETYLNVVYYGNRAYGAEAAAQTYFGKSARELTLPEASLLAGLPQSPVQYDPYLHFEAARARQREVLDRMVNAELATREEAARAFSTSPAFKMQQAASANPEQAPHWVNYVLDVVRARYGPEELFTGGLKIRTTIDLEVQHLAEQIVAQNEEVRQTARANNTAMVVIEPLTGQVLAMVGSKDFYDTSIAGQVNVATAVRQPGSSIKPLVFLTGFERGLAPFTEVQDSPTAFSTPPGQPPYRPENYDNKYYGRITLREALGNSLNIPAVKVLKFVGVPAFQDLARRFGITTLDTWDSRWLSLTLGGGEVRLLEMTGAYATLAREGYRVPVEPFLDVTTARGKVLHQADGGLSGEQAVDPRLVYQLLSIMGDPGSRVATFGANTPLNLGRPHMMKTGTTDDYRDTWTIGCVPQVCVGVWMGNTNNDPMVRVSSSLTAGKIWVDMMNALIERNRWEPVPFPKPQGVVVKNVPSITPMRGQAEHEEVFLEGQREPSVLDMDWMRPDP